MSFDTSGVCSCDPGYTITGVESLGPLRCLESDYVNQIASWDEADAAVVTYHNIITSENADPTGTATLRSLNFEHMYVYAGTLCYSYLGSGGDGLQACQALGNLCVLQGYSPDSASCDLFTTILNNRASSTHGQLGWGATLPWLYYTDNADIVRELADLEMEFTFSSQLALILAKYALDGTWMGLEEMTTQVR
ncbi:unnamed protein product [Choristocarpus tenellus]